jgi:hypothetical protein
LKESIVIIQTKHTELPEDCFLDQTSGGETPLPQILLKHKRAKAALLLHARYREGEIQKWFRKTKRRKH